MPKKSLTFRVFCARISWTGIAGFGLKKEIDVLFESV